jgi:hypothetical protein
MLLGLEGTPREHPAVHLLRVDSRPDAAWWLLVILELLAVKEGGSPILEVGAKAFQGQVVRRGGCIEAVGEVQIFEDFMDVV